ncbi:hypothetical protein ATANTOWER_021763 [Ataeniobius toweri]|uniref:Uncharacterized protein n=1 Tax=Ataeniobius toweri TaxID=208326 RepID=A0ABU7B0Y4_9TELE|nr:hypothetical protein [Ataeniobius toweri]
MGMLWGQQCTSSGNCTSPEPNNTSRDFCYSARIRSTVLQGLPFGGVPTVLALDFMFFLVSVFVIHLWTSQTYPNDDIHAFPYLNKMLPGKCFEMMSSMKLLCNVCVFDLCRVNKHCLLCPCRCSWLCFPC